MKNELQQALTDLEKNLNKLQSATDAISEVKKIASSDIIAAQQTVKEIRDQNEKLDGKFHTWLETFDLKSRRTLSEYGQQAQETVKSLSELNERVKKKVQEVTDELGNANKKLFDKYEKTWLGHNRQVDSLLANSNKLNAELEGLIHLIGTIDFPKRLEKIENAITPIEKGNAERQQESNIKFENLKRQAEALNQKQTEKFIELEGVITNLQNFQDKSRSAQRTQFFILLLAGLAIIFFQLAGYFVKYIKF